MAARYQSPWAAAKAAESGAPVLCQSQPLMGMAMPPSLTLTPGQVASSAMSRRHWGKYSSRLPA